MSTMLCIYEDDHSDRFLPLTWTRPVYELLCGFGSLQRKIRRAYAGVSISYAVREILTETLREKDPQTPVNTFQSETVLFVNGRVLADMKMSSRIPVNGEDRIYLAGEVVVAVRVSGKHLQHIMNRLGRLLGRDDFPDLPQTQVEADLVEYPWELVLKNGEQIMEDYKDCTIPISERDSIAPGVQTVGSAISVSPEAVINPGVVLDASDGPVVIDSGAEVMPLAFIQGPAYIGKHAKVKTGAKIYEGSTIGPVCKVGGEVEASIMHGYSNKQHEGFLGHAYLGEWVNLGADTNNSDLKNNYGTVKVFVNGEFVDSGQMFVGLTMGDHSKTGINTMFNTGTVVGICCNVFGADFPPKAIPSFSWGGGTGFTEYDPERAISTARRVMDRRQVPLSRAYEDLLLTIHRMTETNRKKASVQ